MLDRVRAALTAAGESVHVLGEVVAVAPDGCRVAYSGRLDLA